MIDQGIPMLAGERNRAEHLAPVEDGCRNRNTCC